MLRIKLECKNVPSEKIANCLAKFSRSFPFRYRIEVNEDTIVSNFQVENMSALNELTRRLKHIKGIDFKYTQIEQVLEVEKE